MRDLDEKFAALAGSSFRRRMKLDLTDQRYLADKGIATVLEHARDFLSERLAPAQPKNDGKQTPMRGHPVFVAQHATATCCRGCLAKWHEIAKGRMLSDEEMEYSLEVIRRWLEEQPVEPCPKDEQQQKLF